jgi:AcrR family transcriptional regulator
VPSPGRPRVVDDAEILDAAVTAFAENGFDAVSVRALSTRLGLSHGAVHQRYRSKEELWRASIEHAFTAVTDAVEPLLREPHAGDDLARLRAVISAFLRASAAHPELVQLMNQEGTKASDRLDHLARSVIDRNLAPIMALAGDLATAGLIRPISARSLLFLVAHGAAAPFTLKGLSAHFDRWDGPLDVDAHIDEMTDLVMRALAPEAPEAPPRSHGGRRP